MAVTVDLTYSFRVEEIFAFQYLPYQFWYGGVDACVDDGNCDALPLGVLPDL
ncbi:hypothetical protein GCM10009716_23620 [Streptomyces sodiiphilus]|uniref:Uncharacterized protein n=1 Tax=Streptomyces sodiiphilus TaxID=226217 RepID=A0ABN2P609_9ACTN